MHLSFKFHGPGIPLVENRRIHCVAAGVLADYPLQPQWLSRSSCCSPSSYCIVQPMIS